MMYRSIVFLALIFSTVTLSGAFAPTKHHTFQQARLIQGAPSYKRRVLFMSDESKEKTSEGEKTAAAPSQPEGNYYDDEVRGVVLHREGLVVVGSD